MTSLGIPGTILAIQQDYINFANDAFVLVDIPSRTLFPIDYLDSSADDVFFVDPGRFAALYKYSGNLVAELAGSSGAQIYNYSRPGNPEIIPKAMFNDSSIIGLIRGQSNQAVKFKCKP